MKAEIKEISVSEFFEKNRQLLGYDNKAKALLTIVKEGVDNALDACEEAGILPDIYVSVKEVENEKYEIRIRDNGPGIEKKQIPRVFGKLLYGSKFHRLKQSRGQQGIGISGAVLYSQLTSGEATVVKSSTGDGRTHVYKIKIDVKKNEPIILGEMISFGNVWHGVEIRLIAEGVYKEHKQSILEYLKRTAIINPHANIVFDSPKGRVVFKRATDKLPKEAKEIKIHLDGVEIGLLSRMLYETKARSLETFFTTEFSRIGKKTAIEICNKACIDCKAKPKELREDDIKKLMRAIKHVKLLRPPTDCLSPLGEDVIEAGLKKELNPEFVTAVSRFPSVYRGRPFQVEVGIAYGGSIKQAEIMRFANRVPLLYQQGECAITKSVFSIDWKRYGIQVNSGVISDPVVILVHILSVWVPFTSESKEAIGSYGVIIKEIKLALQDAARKLRLYLAGKRKREHIERKMRIFERYAGEIANSLYILTGVRKDEIYKMLVDLINSKVKGGEEGGHGEKEEVG
ncbi:MAG TPA: DNA topoisomerase VI subunit B [Candidatus Aenigmarchaeota archaeon]|nr:MAG: DNA topoisomerase VI subunit B [Candidatus Aenigmarchaeota archaeon]HDD46195.1 DNA topoisomerase VI subunit B [Candidatus Aenigmarchaeota archaeon]